MLGSPHCSGSLRRFFALVAGAIVLSIAFGLVRVRAAPGPIVLQAPSPQANARFGLSLATGDVNGDGAHDVIVGADSAEVGGAGRAGQVLVFLGPDLSSVISLEDPEPEANAHFGWAVTAGDVNGDGVDDVVVGAYGSQVAGEDVAGEVFVFLGPGLDDVIALTDPAPESTARFGWSLAVGDVNGDGNNDLIVGARGSDVGDESSAGQVFLFPGPDLMSVITFEDPVPELDAYFGWSVATGDVNGDGVADLVVGGRGSDLPEAAHAGEAFVFLGPDLDEATTLAAPEPTRGALLGTSIAAADVNGDRVDDVIVGASGEWVGGSGEAFVFLAPSFSDVVTLQHPTLETGAFLGNSVTAGDVNGDGSAEVVVGAMGSDVEDLGFAGKAFLFMAPDLSEAIPLEDMNPQARGAFGSSVAVGDVEGDRRPDVIVGAAGADVAGVRGAGRAFVFSGSTLLEAPDMEPVPGAAQLESTATEPEPPLTGSGGYLDSGDGFPWWAVSLVLGAAAALGGMGAALTRRG